MQAALRNPPDPPSRSTFEGLPFYTAHDCVAIDAESRTWSVPAQRAKRRSTAVSYRTDFRLAVNTLRECDRGRRRSDQLAIQRPSDPPASPLRPDVFSAGEERCGQHVAGVTVLPGMMTGMTDSLLRAANIPSYGVTAFHRGGRQSGARQGMSASGSDFYAGLEFYDGFMKELVGQ